MQQGGVLWKTDILNMLVYKGEKTKVYDMVCVWVRSALVLVSAHHFQWVHPLLVCLAVLPATSWAPLWKAGSFSIPKAGSQLAASHMPGEEKERGVSPSGSGWTGGKLCFESPECVRAREWGETRLRTLMISATVTCSNCEPSLQSLQEQTVGFEQSYAMEGVPDHGRGLE